MSSPSFQRRKLRFGDGSFNILASVYEQNSAWEDAVQCLEVAAQKGPKASKSHKLQAHLLQETFV